MKFHDLTTAYQGCGQLLVPGSSPESFYSTLIKEAGYRLLQQSTTKLDKQALITQFNQCETERDWTSTGKPYYKIHTPLLPFFIDTRLDVPAQYLKAPFETFLIRFPENHGIENLMASEHEVRSILINETPSDRVLPLGKEDVECERQICLWIDFGERLLLQEKPRSELTIHTFQVLKIFVGDSIDTALARQIDNIDEESMAYGIKIPFSVVEACVRISAATCFLATGGDKLVEPDVLNKDLQRYLQLRKDALDDNEEAEERIEVLRARAERRGKKGWVLGREVAFPDYHSSSEHTSTGRHLKYQHQRRPHFHVVRFGPNKESARVEWYRQLTVRPDLPAPPITPRKGYVAK
jgi:hypothetical protein